VKSEKERRSLELIIVESQNRRKSSDNSKNILRHGSLEKYKERIWNFEGKQVYIEKESENLNNNVGAR